MLLQIHGELSPASRYIKDITGPAFFPHSLEYSVPARGTWNIVHTGMLVPESHHIYMCASGCLRGVVLTAAEMGADYRRRFSTIELKSPDLVTTDNEQLMIDGITDIINNLDYTPRAVFVFPACVHHFLGCNLRYVYRELQRRFPGLDFAECFMDPVCQTNPRNLTPEDRLRRAITRLWDTGTCEPHTLTLFNSNFPMAASSPVYEIARAAGWQIHDAAACRSYDEFRALGHAAVFAYTSPMGHRAARDLRRRTGRPVIYLPQQWRAPETTASIRQLLTAMDLTAASMPDTMLACHREDAASGLAALKAEIGSLPIAIDYTFTHCLFSMARALIEAGLNVVRLYADACLPEEAEDFQWLQQHSPDLEIYSAKQADMRFAVTADALAAAQEPDPPRRILALGQKAAYYTASPYFVSVIESGGAFGLSGLADLSQEMLQASRTPKNLEKTISPKGWRGPCELCL